MWVLRKMICYPKMRGLRKLKAEGAWLCLFRGKICDGRVISEPYSKVRNHKKQLLVHTKEMENFCISKMTISKS